MFSGLAKCCILHKTKECQDIYQRGTLSLRRLPSGTVPKIICTKVTIAYKEERNKSREKNDTGWGRKHLTWPLMTPASWYSCPCVIPSTWVWAGPSNSPLIQQKWWAGLTSWACGLPTQGPAFGLIFCWHQLEILSSNFISGVQWRNGVCTWAEEVDSICVPASFLGHPIPI